MRRRATPEGVQVCRKQVLPAGLIWPVQSAFGLGVWRPASAVQAVVAHLLLQSGGRVVLRADQLDQVLNEVLVGDEQVKSTSAVLHAGLQDLLRRRVGGRLVWVSVEKAERWFAAV